MLCLYTVYVRVCGVDVGVDVLQWCDVQGHLLHGYFSVTWLPFVLYVPVLPLFACVCIRVHVCCAYSV